jgi:hypothetical protein
MEVENMGIDGSVGGEVTLPFTFNGETFTYGKMWFHVAGLVNVEGFNINMPVKFALMLLTDRASWSFLEAVSNAPLLKWVKEELLERAALKGLASARQVLNGYLANAPNGKPRFYKSRGSQGVDLTDGLVGMRFWISNDLKEAVSQLPENIYCEVKNLYFDLDSALYAEISSQPEEFFKFASRLVAAFPYLSHRRCGNCLKMYFSERPEAYRLLEEIERDVAWRRARDAFWKRLDEEEVVRCAEGFLVTGRRYGEVFYVTEDGQVFELLYEGADILDIAYRTYRTGKPPRHIVEVEDPNELKFVARTVAKVSPNLSVLIAP